MCRRVTCPVCKKPTFAGCGLHIEQVLGDIPPQERCSCHEKTKSTAPANQSKSNEPSKPWWKIV